MAPPFLPVPKATPLDALLSVAAAFGVAMWARAQSKIEQAAAKLEKTEKALRELRERPETAEFRIERFEVLWFPVVTASIQNMEIVGVNTGVPHCPKCAVPLAIDKKDWTCARCSARFPESLSDAMVLDSVTELALKYFRERRSGYRVAVKGLKPSA